MSQYHSEPNAHIPPSSDHKVPPSYPRHWRRPPQFFRRSWHAWAALLAGAAYVIIAGQSVHFDAARLQEGWSRGAAFVSGFIHPDFVTRREDIIAGLIESITMTVTATAVGVAISVPIGIGAARNVTIAPIYYLCRGIIALSRALQEIIVAIFLVAMFGFGPFAGFLTLAFASIGFVSKLLADEIEESQKASLEAIKATGASWLQWINYSVQPQAMPRLIGLSLYRLDINFRESAVIGIVGAGGIGATLNTSIDRYEYDSAAAILLIIIAIVVVLEYSSGRIRQWVQ